MSAAVLQHPAVAVAAGVAHSVDTAMVPVAVVARDEIAAVLLESPDHRLVVFVPFEDGNWVAPGMSGGTRPPAEEGRRRRTGDTPLTGVSGRGFCGVGPSGEPLELGWFAVAGRAAADATEIVLTSGVDTATEVIGADGLAFALVRTRMIRSVTGDIPTFEKPEIRVSTMDGRSVPMRLP